MNIIQEKLLRNESLFSAFLDAKNNSLITPRWETKNNEIFNDD
jgi:hypothetical protein